MSLAAHMKDAGGRRFLLVIGASAIYTVLFALSFLSENGYITLQLITVGAYLGANGHQKHMEIKNGN